ncbi:MAG: monooxygenase [Myxococcota bacterium]
MTRVPTLLPLCTFVLSISCGDSTPSEQDSPDTASTGAEGDPPGDTGSEAEPEPATPTYTYWRDAKSIIDAKCANCHQPDDIAPFPLVNYDDVQAVAAVLPASLQGQTMPPWPPDSSCQDYAHSRALDPQEQQVLLTWLDEGAPEGDPSQAPTSDDEPSGPAFTPTLSIEMPEPYTPTAEPDDYRCFPVAWPESDTRFITGYQVIPGNRSIVHHVIVFNASADLADEVAQMDADDPGPGYTCFGNAGVQAQSVSSWVPGSNASALPEGTGVQIEPGSVMIIQMHYNTLSSEPASDQTRLELVLADQVERPALTLPVVNFQWITGGEPMHIPAGDPAARHSFDLSASNPFVRQQLNRLGIESDEPFLVHGAGLHMHYLGTQGLLSVLRDDGAEDCVLQIDQWDFGWQGSYTLREPLRVDPQDQLHISCTWDNSASNQPTVDGEVLPPQDVEWGEGTTDEMCLGSLYVSAE